MSTGLLQRASHAGHTPYHATHDAGVVDADQGSPQQIFVTFASAVGLLAVTGTIFALVAQLAHVIDTSWQIL